MARAVRIAVADAAIDWMRLEPYTDRKRVLRTAAGRTDEIGSLTEQLRLFEENGRPVLERAQMLDTSAFGSRADTTVIYRDDFAPLRYSSVSRPERVEAVYEPGHVRTRHLRNGLVTASGETRLAQAVFDAHSLELAVRLLPLAEGYRATLPAFDANRDLVFNAAVVVTGTDSVEAGSRSFVPAWTVEIAYAESRHSYALSTETGEILRQRTRLPDGSEVVFVP